jgi:uncharacterized protein (DUF2141 family)
MKYKWAAILLLTSLIAQQCAKQTAPTGGPKDETPPILLKSTPAHESTKVTKDEIELTFDEFVQLNNARDQIIITPSVGKKFEALAKKNKVILKLNTSLQANTTYNVNFRESIQDITEKNPASVKLAFSTGTYIDSLGVTGRVVDILSEKDASNYIVALALASDTLNIFKHPATWITLTNKQGRYALENLKEATYFLYAFDDKNKNLIVDSKSEKYAFKGEPITLQSNLDSVKLNSFKMDASAMKLISTRPTFSYYNIRLSKSITEYSLTEPKDSIPLYSMVDTDLTSIRVYNSIGTFDSLQVRLQALDSMQSKIDTLIYLKFSKKESTKDKLNAKIESCNLYEDNSMLKAIVSFTKPMTFFNPDSLYIQVDSVTRTTFVKEDFNWNSSQTQLTISRRLEVAPKETVAKAVNSQTKPDPRAKGKTLDKTGPSEPNLTSLPNEEKPIKIINQIILAKGSIISVENDSIQKLTSPIKTVRSQDTGIILTKVESQENFILQLITKNFQVVEEVVNKKDHRFTNLPAGTYLLRLLIDKNKNGKWDAGDYAAKKEPEPIVFYKSPKNIKDINLKANWEVGPLLITY